MEFYGIDFGCGGSFDLVKFRIDEEIDGDIVCL